MARELSVIMDEQNKLLEKQKNASKATANELYDSKAQTIKDTYTQQIADSEDDYADAHRENAVQKKVNEFYIAEEMANMGLTDSGMNRTQITANQLSYANRKAEINQKRQSMVDALAREMAARQVDVENERKSTLQGIDDSYTQLAAENAQKIYSSEVDADAVIEKARIESEQKRIEAEQKASYIIQTNGGNLSRNFIGSLKDNGVSVRYNSNGTTTYTDNNSGKSSTFDSSINPYTGNNNETENSATAKAWNEYGCYDNGYQPKGVYNYGAFDKAVDTTPIYGRNQNIFVTTEKQGTHYWLWDGALNKYIEVFKNKEGKWEEKVG